MSASLEGQGRQRMPPPDTVGNEPDRGTGRPRALESLTTEVTSSFADAAIDPAKQVGLAIRLAARAHVAQCDKVGAAYITHPSLVAGRFDSLDDPVAAAAAWLHDVIEDTDLDEQALADAGVAPEVIEVVCLMTRRVKLADIADNTDERRVARLGKETRQKLATKYARARVLLGVHTDT